jgi:hypothetical protein
VRSIDPQTAGIAGLHIVSYDSRSDFYWSHISNAARKRVAYSIFLVLASQGYVLPEHAITDEKDHAVGDISPSMIQAARSL